MTRPFTPLLLYSRRGDKLHVTGAEDASENSDRARRHLAVYVQPVFIRNGFDWRTGRGSLT